jgi:DNA-binding CsgD family transcriptional regulator
VETQAAPVIDQQTYLALRERYRATGAISEELYRLLLRLVRGFVFRGELPPAYSPTGRWDAEGAEEAAHGWIIRRLLQTNALLAAFDHATAPRPFFRSLERSFRHYLENERERGEIDNLVSRAGALLRDDDRFREWIPQARPSDSWWGLAGWTDPNPYQGSEDALLREAWAVGEVRLFRYSHKVERASPVLATDALGRFLETLFERVEALVTLRLLAVVFRRRFDLDPPATIEIGEEEIERLPAGEEEGEEAEAAAAALAVAAELTPRQAEILVRKADGASLDVIGEALGISRGTVDNELKRAGVSIDRHRGEFASREAVLEKLLDALS